MAVCNGVRTATVIGIVATQPPRSGYRQRSGGAAAPAPLSSGDMHFRSEFAEVLTEHLIDLSQVFDGDLQQALILAVLGRLHLRALIAGACVPPARPPAISASGIAALTAIPRETVRRKLLTMKKKHWLDQDDRQAWRLTKARDGRSNALISLLDIDARGIERATRLARVLQEGDV